jgi:uncharacterized membrane protein YdcZ (DUF606 family)
MRPWQRPHPTGILIALQSGINATLGAYAGQAFASVMSFVTGLVLCLAYFAADVTVLGTPLPSLQIVKGAALDYFHIDADAFA